MMAYLTKGTAKDIRTGETVTIRAIYEDAEKTALLWRGLARSVQDYIDECLHGENECALLVEKFEHSKTGKDIIVWSDYEVNEVYISY